MTNKHPITPPDKQLVRKWIEDWAGGQMKGPVTEDQLVVATKAARWGADQELEACINYFYEYDRQRWGENSKLITGLRAARRPKPPTLKERAKAELDRLIALIPAEGALAMAEPIRRALEALPE